MEPVWQWGINVIHTIQLTHGPVLDAIFLWAMKSSSSYFFR
jgi:hypothetical protein